MIKKRTKKDPDRTLKHRNIDIYEDQWATLQREAEKEGIAVQALIRNLIDAKYHYHTKYETKTN